MTYPNETKQLLLNALKEITWDYSHWTCSQISSHTVNHPHTYSIRKLYEDLGRALLAEQLGTRKDSGSAWLENMLIDVGMTSVSDVHLARKNLIAGLIKQLEEELNV